MSDDREIRCVECREVMASCKDERLLVGVLQNYSILLSIFLMVNHINDWPFEIAIELCHNPESDYGITTGVVIDIGNHVSRHNHNEYQIFLYKEPISDIFKCCTMPEI